MWSIWGKKAIGKGPNTFSQHCYILDYSLKRKKSVLNVKEVLIKFQDSVSWWMCCLQPWGPLSFFALSLCLSLALHKTRAKSPLALIYNPHSEHIHSLTHSHTHAHTARGQLFRRSWHHSMWRPVGADMLTPVYTIYRTDRETCRNNQVVDEDICPATGCWQTLMLFSCVCVYCVTRESEVFHV